MNTLLQIYYVIWAVMFANTEVEKFPFLTPFQNVLSEMGRSSKSLTKKNSSLTQLLEGFHVGPFYNAQYKKGAQRELFNIQTIISNVMVDYGLRPFLVRMKSVFSCPSCGGTLSMPSEQPCNHISIAVPNVLNRVVSLEELYGKGLRQETCDSDTNMRECSTCQTPVRPNKSLSFFGDGDILVVKLERSDGAGAMKFATKLSVPIAWELGPLGKDDIPQSYSLLAAACHRGTAGEGSQGHWTSYCKQANGAWVHCNDKAVTRQRLPRALEGEMAHQFVCKYGEFFFYKKN